MAKNYLYELGFPFLEREIFPPRDEKKKMGAIRGNILQHGRANHTGDESLHRV